MKIDKLEREIRSINPMPNVDYIVDELKKKINRKIKKSEVR